jgi:hypothetical protein
MERMKPMIDARRHELDNRLLPPNLVTGFLRGLVDEFGIENLQLLLKKIELNQLMIMLEGRRIGEMHASEWATLQKEIRNQFGANAPEILNRAGRAAWRWMTREATFNRQLELRQANLLPKEVRRLKALQLLAAHLRHSSNSVVVYTLGADLIFVDSSSDTTWGITIDDGISQPICWTTLGMIQSALILALGNEPQVEEFSCRATGGISCQFKIKD